MATETFPCFPVSWHKGSSQVLHSILPASVSLKSLPMPRSFTLCILFGDQQTSDPRLQDFCKSGYKTLHLSKCVLGRLSIIQLQRSGGTFPLRAQTPTKDELHGQASASSSSPLHSLLAPWPSRRKEEGQHGPLLPCSGLSECSLAHAGLRRP